MLHRQKSCRKMCKSCSLFAGEDWLLLSPQSKKRISLVPYSHSSLDMQITEVRLLMISLFSFSVSLFLFAFVVCFLKWYYVRRGNMRKICV